MRRQNHFSPVPHCCHCNNNHQRDSLEINQNSDYQKSHNSIRDEYSKIKSTRRHSLEPTYCSEEQLDEGTLHKFTSMRQKACKFISEELECSSSSFSDSRQKCTCQENNVERESSMLQREAESIDYVPQSEFLKKIKRQLQCRCNNNQIESQSKSNEVIPKVCEECITKSNEIIRLLQQLHSHGQTATNQYTRQCRPCQCSLQQEQDKTGINKIVKTCRSVVDELKNVLNGECFNDNDLILDRNESQNAEDYFSSRETRPSTTPKSKSQHVSRPKKRVQCRGRRKRKSDECEKNRSQDRFEPSLKKPHENSCERCWRYASPSRSPVNKPAQRFDPNFRRAHSCQDFLSTEGGESEANRSTLETPGKMQPLVNKKAVEPAHCRAQDSNYGSTKVKELMMENSNFHSLRTQYQKSRSNMQEHLNKKPRPKSCTPGVFSRPRENFRSPNDAEGSFEYKDIRFKRPYTPGNIKQNLWTHGDTNLNSSYLRERPYQTNEKPKIWEDYGDARMKFNKDSSHNSGLSKLKKNYDGDLSSTIPPKADQTATNFSAPYYVCCKECTCNKTHLAKTASSKHGAAQSLKKSPVPAEFSPSVQTKSSEFTEDKCRNFSREKRHYASDLDAPSLYLGSDGGEHTLGSPRLGRMEHKDRKEYGGFKCCTCRSLSPKPAIPNTLPEEINFSINQGKPKCCYCRPSRNCSERTNKNLPLMNVPQPQTHAQLDKDNSSLVNGGLKGCGRSNCPYISQQAVFEKDNHPGRRVPCPYQSNTNESTEFLSNCDCTENERRSSNEKKTNFCGSRRSAYSPKYQNLNNSNCNAPKKYCVFYMTKSKGEKGNEVEVLVEELTERCKANNQGVKMTALKDKMRKLDDCPSDSMALRFQKGVNESSKINRPEASRILYF